VIEVITQVWNAIVADPAMIAFWAAGATPEMRRVRLFYDMPDRDEPLPYINYLIGGAAHGAVWPSRDERLAFSVYDFYSAENTAMQIARRVQQICVNRIWYPSSAVATGCRTWGILTPPHSIPTNNKLAVRVDFALSLRWYDAEVAQAGVFGGTR
jgi:hypothetical protein